MKFVGEIAAGLAASAAFAVVEHYLVPLDDVWRWGGMAAFFVIMVVIVAAARRGRGSEDRRDKTRMMSDVTTDRKMTATINCADIETAADADIMSNNKVGGDAHFTIQDAKIRRS